MGHGKRTGDREVSTTGNHREVTAAQATPDALKPATSGAGFSRSVDGYPGTEDFCAPTLPALPATTSATQQASDENAANAPITCR